MTNVSREKTNETPLITTPPRTDVHAAAAAAATPALNHPASVCDNKRINRKAAV